MKNNKKSFVANDGKGIKAHPEVDIKKLNESIVNMQDQIKMLEKSRAQITERLIRYQALYRYLSRQEE